MSVTAADWGRAANVPTQTGLSRKRYSVPSYEEQARLIILSIGVGTALAHIAIGDSEDASKCGQDTGGRDRVGARKGSRSRRVSGRDGRALLPDRDGNLQEDGSLPPTFVGRDRKSSRSREDAMSKGLIRSLNRRGSQSDKTPAVARKQTFSDPSICDRCGAVYTEK